MELGIEGLKKQLLEKVTDLPEARVQEVLDFVDFLRLREQSGSEDAVLQVVGCLSGPPLSVGDIEDELYGKDPA